MPEKGQNAQFGAKTFVENCLIYFFKPLDKIGLMVYNYHTELSTEPDSKKGEPL
jgi:hypothetical protein